MEKQLWVFVYLYKIWQILKCFGGTFHRAQTLKLGGVNLVLLLNKMIGTLLPNDAYHIFFHADSLLKIDDNN